MTKKYFVCSSRSLSSRGTEILFMKTKQKTVSLSFNVLSSESDFKTTSASGENKARDCEH